MKLVLEEYGGDLPADVDHTQILQAERDCFGFYLNGHPIEQYLDTLKQLNIKPVSQVNESYSEIPIAGLISKLQIKKTKRNTDYAVITLEDGIASLNFKCWSTAPLRGIEEGACVVAPCTNSKYGWTLSKRAEITIL